MALEVTLQRLNESMDEGKIVAWLKKEGDFVKKGDPLVEVETSKATVTMESMVEGTLLKILAEVDAEIAVGTVIALVGDKNEKVEVAAGASTTASAAKPESKEAAPTAERQEVKDVPRTGGRIFVSPLARKMAAAENADLAKITGSSVGGRIVKKDVLNYLAQKPIPAAKVVPGQVEDIKYSSRRKIIASRMTESMRTKPFFVLTVEVIMDKVEEIRRTFKTVEEQKISVTAILTKAVCKALGKYAYMNVHVRDDGVTRFSDKNIGIAVGDEKGLTVPVIKKAQELSLLEIAGRIGDLSGRVRKGTIGLDDLSGGTFTISNLGMFGIESFSAVINPPEGAILAVGNTNERYMKINGEAKFVPVMKLSLSIDHRAIDGDQGALFLGEIKKYMENPSLML
jgi:pyruvate dehydrogenase E2 component (dihydrolipoyllysine-residue acetyltransferase)